MGIQEHLSEANLGEGVLLDVKVGIGVGNISVLHMGGVLRRMEYVAVGMLFIMKPQCQLPPYIFILIMKFVLLCT